MSKLNFQDLKPLVLCRRVGKHASTMKQGASCSGELRELYEGKGALRGREKGKTMKNLLGKGEIVFFSDGKEKLKGRKII